MEEFVNDELGYEIKNNLIQLNETKVSYEEGYDTEANH